jgi:uncharacterized membrane protein
MIKVAPSYLSHYLYNMCAFLYTALKRIIFLSGGCYKTFTLINEITVSFLISNPRSNLWYLICRISLHLLKA